MLDTHPDLPDTDISSKHFVYLQNVFKTSSRHVFKTCLQDLFARPLQDFFKTPWKMKNCYTKDVLNTSSRLTNVCWDIIKIIKSLEDSGVLIDGVTETVKDEIESKKTDFLELC